MRKTMVTGLISAVLYILLAAQPTGAQVPSGYLSNDQISGNALGGSDRATVVLIHGWNPDGYANKFADGDWPQLVNALSSRLNGSGWKLLLFHWENDASTGPVIDTDIGETGFYNAREAANNAFLNGTRLADLLNDAAPELRKVIIIAHSAGSWAAHRAASKLLDYNPYVVINVALLDPFIPGVDPSIATPLDTSLMGQLDDHSDSARIFRIENYYAIDAGTDYDFDFGQGGGSRATSQTFNWRSRDINHRVDYTSTLPPDIFYNDHGGPIRFYADTVAAAGGSSTPGGLALAPWEFTQVGWFRSLSYEWFLLPRIQTHPQSQARAVGTAITLTVTATDSRPLFYRWYRNGTELPATAATYSFSLSSQNAGEYVVCVSNVNGMVFSDKAVVSIDDNLASPSSLSATPASSSQVNLSWTDNAANETGFKVERRLGSSGSWSQIATRPANVTTYSDTGRTAATLYQYRVRAYNGSGDSAYSSVASATTLSDPGSTHTLTIRSVNPSSGLDVSSYVGSGQFAFGTTPTTRTFAHASGVGVNCFPTTLASGYVFQKWLLDGEDYDYTPSTVLYLDRNRTLTAVYGATPLPPRNLSSLTIEGPSSVDERSSEQYLARANYSDGSSGYVIASWDDDSSYASISASGLLDADSVSSDRDIEIEASFTLNGVTRTDTKNVTIENTDAVPTYTLTRNSTAGGSIGQSPSGTTFAEGTVVSLHGNADDGYVFSHWTGDASGAEDDITITMNGNRSVTANFTADTSYGRLQVNLSPQQAVNEGAQWKYSTFTTWRDSGSIQDGITPRTNKNINFKDIPGWITPDNIKASVVGGQTTVKSATYREILGAVQVTLTPDQVKTAGARWRVDGGSWTESGVALTDVSTGSHTVQFLAVAGWTTPQIQTVTVSRGVTTAGSGDYLPPAGYPVITAVYPKTGPIEGGTEVTLEGINFQPGTAVLFGGEPAASCTLASASQVIAVTPPRASYGTVSLSLISGGHTTMQANGFSYLNPLGSNIDLVGHFGGLVQAVDVVGNMAYYGEGPGLVVADFSNSASPVERGRIAVPGVVKGVAVVSNVAFVAAGTAGIYAIDVSSPTAPSIVGFFDTEGSASGLAASNGYAYVADGAAGLQILSIATPSAITRAGVFDTAGVAGRVSFGIIGSRKYAFLAEDVGTRVVDVTEPSTPFEVSSVAAQSASGIRDVLVVGTKLYVSDWGAGIKIFNASNPSNLVLTGTSGGAVGSSIDVLSNRLYKCDGFFQITDVSTSTPNDLGDFLAGSFCEDIKVAATLAFLAMGDEGLIVLRVSNPSSISQRSRIQAVGALAVQLVSGFALVGDGQGMHSINISNAASPSRASSLMGDGVTDIAIASNGIASLVNMGASSVRIANASNPSALSLSGVYSNFRASAVAQLGNNPILVGQAGSSPRYAMLDIIGVTTPSSPQRVGSLVLANVIESARAVAIAGTWAFCAREDSDIVDVVSLATPSSPVLTGTIPVSNGGRIASIAAKADANYVFVSRTNGVEVIDVSVKSAPLSILVLDSTPVGDGWVSSIEVSGNRLFAVKEGFLSVYDIANPTAPELIGYYDIPGSGRGLAVSNDLIFVAGNSAGLDILRLRDLTMPSITIISPTNASAYTSIVTAVSIAGTATDNKAVARVSWVNDRGGGGVATGTTSWAVTNVQLAAGLNRVTVTAEDANGNRGTDAIDINLAVPDTTPPVVMIIGPNPDDEFTVDTPIITLSGSVADNESVAGMTCSNNLSPVGIVERSGQTWSVTNLQLTLGANIVQVHAVDSSGNSVSDTAVVFLIPPDTNSPIVSIDFPTVAATFETGIGAINLSGTALDDGEVRQVSWTSGSGTQGVANGVSPWSANSIPLKAGFNVIEVTAEDAVGNVSADTLAVIYTPPPLTVAAVQGMSNGVFNFDLAGPLGGTYVIEASSNLLQWVPFSTNTIPGEDSIIITAPNTGNLPILFYRATSVSP